MKLLFFTDIIMDDRRVERAIRIAKKCVAAFSYSWKKKRDMKKYQEDHDQPTHKLVSECTTRWGSRFKMVERILEQKNGIAEVLGADKKTRHLVLNWQDLEVLEVIDVSLKGVNEFTDALSGEKYVSVSYLLPVLHLFEDDVLAEKDEDADLTKELKSKVFNYIQERYDDTEIRNLINMATMVDPRFRSEYLSADSLTALKATMVEEILQIVGESAERSGSGTASTSANASNTDAPAESPESEPPVKKKKMLASFFKQKTPSAAASAPAVISREERIRTEIDTYLCGTVLDKEEDALEWWKLHCKDFPHISHLARKYLCVQATSSPSERIFSTAGNIVTHFRSSLKPEKVNQLVFLAHNMK
jgi:hypothetical protein